jgi:hypothetical protein
MAASRALAALLAVAVLLLVSSSVPRVMAGDPSPLQDFCVADMMNPGMSIHLHFACFISFTQHACMMACACGRWEVVTPFNSKNNGCSKNKLSYYKDLTVRY